MRFFSHPGRPGTRADEFINRLVRGKGLSFGEAAANPLASVPDQGMEGMMILSRRALMANGAAALALAPGLARGAVDVRALHKKLICLDTHLDMPANLARPGWDVMKRHHVDEDFTQVDYPRMVEGGLDGGFFAIYTPQAPLTPEGMSAMRDAAFLRAAEIREMVAAHPRSIRTGLPGRRRAAHRRQGQDHRLSVDREFRNPGQ